jgi:hypothetical protein
LIDGHEIIVITMAGFLCILMKINVKVLICYVVPSKPDTDLQ